MDEMKKVVLRRLEIEDASLMLDWMINPDIYSKMQYDHTDITLDKCIIFIKNSWEDSKNLHLAISSSDGGYMGTVSLKNLDYKNNIAELGIAIHPFFSGKGNASLALFEMAKRAFFEMGLNKIYLYVRSDNSRAVAFWRKNKMEFEGCAKEHLFIDGEYKDILWFSLRKRNFAVWSKRFYKFI